MLNILSTTQGPIFVEVSQHEGYLRGELFFYLLAQPGLTAAWSRAPGCL